MPSMSEADLPELAGTVALADRAGAGEALLMSPEDFMIGWVGCDLSTSARSRLGNSCHQAHPSTDVNNVWVPETRFGA